MFSPLSFKSFIKSDNSHKMYGFKTGM